MTQQDERTTLSALRDILADLYPTEAKARRIVFDAKLNEHQIEFGDSANIFWHAIVEEARKSHKVQNLLDIARKEYPDNESLRKVENDYRRLPSHDRRNGTVPSPEPHAMRSPLEQPHGTVAPISPFYIEREADHTCKIYFQRAATVFVKGPRQVGKSSLMQRINYIMKEEQDVEVAYISLERFDNSLFDNLESFLIELCRQICDALEIPDEIDQYWSSKRLAPLAKCSNCMTDYILQAVNGPLILAIDRMEKLLDAPFRNDFFGMLRTWHNDRAHDPDFQKLSLFLSSSTEPHLFINNPNQSPFAVALPIELNDFTLTELRELNHRHQQWLRDDELLTLRNLLNGHPFLTRLAFYQIAMQQWDVATLLDSATTDSGPFYEHLLFVWQLIDESRELRRAVRQICRRQNFPENIVYYRLKEAGLVRRVDGKVQMRNKLYEQFFAKQFGITI